MVATYCVILCAIYATLAAGQFFGQEHFGQPLGNYGSDGDDFDQETTPEELQSKRINPLPHLVNPGIRRGVQNLQQIEARYQRQPNQPQFLRPLLDLLTNPSRRR